MGNIALCALKAALPKSPLTMSQRSAVFWLADAANNRTGLAWLAQETLMGLVGCAESTIGPAIAAAEKAGMLSILRRMGKHSLYLVHPQGLAAFASVAASLVRDHLRGRFPKAEIEQIVEWMIAKGVIRRGKSASTMQDSPPTPPTIRGADGRSAQPTQSLGDSPPSYQGATPLMIGPEPKETRKEPKEANAEMDEAERKEIANGLRRLTGALALNLSANADSRIGKLEGHLSPSRFRG